MNTAPLDHTSPWVIDTRAEGLTHRDGPGLATTVQFTAPPPQQTISGVLEITAASEVAVGARLESVAEGVLVTGTARADATGTCSRCLREITVPIEASFQELYAYPDSLTAATTDADEVPRIVDEALDIAPLVHDELVLAMPAIPLCRPDCPGLCPECGERLDSVGDDHRHEILDPRWAALSGLLDQDPVIVDPAQKEK